MKRKNHFSIPPRLNNRGVVALLILLIGIFITSAAISHRQQLVTLAQTNMRHLRWQDLVTPTPTPLPPTPTPPSTPTPTTDPSLCPKLIPGELRARYAHEPNAAGKVEVVVTSLAKACSYKIGVVSYSGYLPYSQDPKKMDWLFTQTYYTHTEAVIRPGQVLTLAVAVPNCKWQVDAYQGEVIKVLSPGNTMGEQGRLIDGGFYADDGPACPTPTPGEPSTEPTAAPSSDPTTAPSPEPTAQPTTAPTAAPPSATHACPVDATFVAFPGWGGVQGIGQNDMTWECAHCGGVATHRAIDMVTYKGGGTPVVAIVGGTASKLDDGRSIVLNGDDGKMYFYTHMGERSIPSGRTAVTKGQRLGTVAVAGAAANNGVAHLHVHVTTNGDNYHPDTYIGPLLDTWCSTNACNGKPQSSCGYF